MPLFLLSVSAWGMVQQVSLLNRAFRLSFFAYFEDDFMLNIHEVIFGSSGLGQETGVLELIFIQGGCSSPLEDYNALLTASVSN
jgi:hypothetical protein